MAKEPQKAITSIVKSNSIINSRYDFTITETRLFLNVLSQIQPTDEDFKDYSVSVKDLAITDNTLSGIYENVRDTAKKLLKKPFEIPKDNGFVMVNLFSRVEYKKGSGVVNVDFHPVLKPYFLQLQKHFTVYDIRNVLSCKSTFSIRIYELLKEYLNKGLYYREFELEDLKFILNIEKKYTRYNDFKRYVLLVAQDELKAHTDLYFEFEEIKEGRKITRIKFFIYKQERKRADNESRADQQPAAAIPTQQPKEKKPPRLTPEQQELFSRMVRLGLSESQALEQLGKRETGYIKTNLDLVEKRAAADKIENLGGYTWKALEENFSQPSIFEMEQQQAKEKKQADKKAQEEKQKKNIEKAGELKAAFDILRQEKLTIAITDLNHEPEEWQKFQKWLNGESGKFYKALFDKPGGKNIVFNAYFEKIGRLEDHEKAFIDYAKAQGCSVQKNLDTWIILE